VRAATALICKFIAGGRKEFGVAPICRALLVHGVESPRVPTGRTGLLCRGNGSCGIDPRGECSLSKEAAFVESAIRQAAGYRARHGYPITSGTIHHSDAGSQYASVHFTETLMLAGLMPSIGTVGDALDHELRKRL